MTNKKKALPTVGDAFAIKLRPGLWGCCRVLKTPNGHEAREFGTQSVLVATSSWVGTQRPDVEQPGLREFLRLTHHSWNGALQVAWIDEPPSSHFKLIGQLQPTKPEAKMKCDALGDWYGVRDSILTQWRWDNERKQLDVEVKQEEAAEHAQLAAEHARRNKEFATTTLEQLARRRFLRTWTQSPTLSAAQKRSSRKILRDAVKEMVSLGPRPSRRSRIAVLKKCIEAFNALNKDVNFIETSERDDICEDFKLIVHACGLGKDEDIADLWRTW